MSLKRDSSGGVEENILEVRERNLNEFKREFEKIFNIPWSRETIIGKNKYNTRAKSKILKPKDLPEVGRRSERLRISEKRNIGFDNDKQQLQMIHKEKCIVKEKRTVPPKDPDEVTDDLIAMIHYTSTGKIYDAVNGTTCHQCRQKTIDTKSVCRGSNCINKRGHFCGFCLLKRYGEDVAEVLKNPLWECPACRNICNCSLCRNKVGKRPTGILVPIVEKIGLKSARDYLEQYSDTSK